MKNRGVALVTGLLMLTAVTLLAVTAAGSMTLQQHQAANFTDKHRASERAATAESWALAWLYSRSSHERSSACLHDCILPTAVAGPGILPSRPEIETLGWWRSHAVPAAIEPSSGETVGFVSDEQEEGYWLIEEIHFELSVAPAGIEGLGYYRILARGDGAAPGSTAVSEAIVARPWGPGVAPLAFPPDALLNDFCEAVPDPVPCGIVAWRKRR
ncbi:MAG: hypothetical protein KJO72_06645 [Gammaproteobacteria bacterium]|nr:hypothetical protein [Gammaproteobacteria bacterium]NNJ79728.1 hypothetical protein [Xanthomonadales bacterium]